VPVGWNNYTLSYGLRAIRRIEPDEELTSSYIDHRLPRNARQQALQIRNFTCQCAWCSLSTEESLQSDRNRHEILTWYDKHHPVAVWFITTPVSENEGYISEGERTIRLCKKEGLEVLMHSFAMNMVLAYSQMADTPNCQKYARMALGIVKARAPPGHKDIGMVEGFIENPKEAAGETWEKRLLNDASSVIPQGVSFCRLF